ncbi:MAG: TldD/PmbA family protein [Cyanobacteria bacterium REEB65]|nr:TldD/PmbA family protein [Cyanobacteria bacterium REEB65]
MSIAVADTDVRTLLDRVLRGSPADATEFNYSEVDEDLTRFGANAITQNVMKRDRSLGIRVQHQGREARVAVSEVDEASITRGIQDAMEIAAVRAPDPDLMPLLQGPQAYRPVSQPDSGPGGPEERAEAVLYAIGQCQAQQARASGICSVTRSRTIVMNSRGIFADASEQRGEFSVTAERQDGSGWAKSCGSRMQDLDVEGVTRRALAKCLKSQNPRPLPAGDYPVVLESAAVAELVRMLPWMAFNALDYLEGRHFAVGKLGERFFDPRISVKDDVWEVPGLPFDYEGVAKRSLPFIDGGRFVGLAHDRHTALKLGAEPTGHGLPWPNTSGAWAINLAMAAGQTPERDLVAGLERGILLTQLHYLNIVDRMDLSITGMTRNGTFWVENGEIAYPVQNLRFTDSLLHLFSRVEAISAERELEAAFWDGNILAPSLRLSQMHFSSPAGF